MADPYSQFAAKLLNLAKPRRKPPPPEAAPGVPYASFNRRMVAALLDSILVILLIAPPMEMIASLAYGPVALDVAEVMRRVQAAPPSEAAIIWSQALHDSGVVSRWLFGSVLQLAVLGVVTVMFWDWRSATPGKMACRIAVVDAKTLKPISNRQAIVRFFAYFVSTFPMMLGFFAITWDAKRQGWHDKIAGTVAVVLPKGKSPADL